MGPHERRAREKEETRVRIIDAARAMFVSDGYEAVTMRRIAERIEYTPTAIYVHFKDKEALIRAVCETDFLRLAQQFHKIATIQDPIARLRKAGHAYAQFGLDFPNHYRLMFMTPRPPIDPKDVAIEQGNVEQDAYAFVRSIVEEAVGKRLFRDALEDVELLTQTIWAGVHGVVSLEIAKENDPWMEWRPFKKRITLMIDTLIDSLVRKKGR
jgi:AcrR family transcriptional regulator